MLLHPRIEPRRSPKQPRAAFTVVVVLQAAAEMIIQYGAEGFRMADLAARAGVGTGTLYQYLPSRDAVLLELRHDLCQRTLELYRRLLNDAANDSLEALVAKLSRVTVDLAEDPLRLALQPTLRRLFAANDVVDTSPAIVEMFARMLHQKLSVDDARARAVSATMVWCADGLIEGLLRQDEAIDPEAVHQHLWVMWSALLRSAV
jgi:AcrR family transcriptional regulator